MDDTTNSEFDSKLDEMIQVDSGEPEPIQEPDGNGEIPEEMMEPVENPEAVLEAISVQVLVAHIAVMKEVQY